MYYRILALDGGGIRGLLTLTILQRLEKAIPGWIDRTDLYAGSSVGGIIALALALGKEISFLAKLLYQASPKVFRISRLESWSRLRQLTHAKYPNRALAQMIDQVLGDVTLDELDRGALVTAFDLDNDKVRSGERSWQPVLFHNLVNGRGHSHMKLAQAAMYTAAAPGFFPSVDGYADGGLIAANPSLVALTQIMGDQSQIARQPSLEEISLLSVGTGLVGHYLEGERHDWGYWQWSRHLVDMMLEGSIMLADMQCRQLLDDRYCRISPKLPAKYTADSWQNSDELIKLAHQLDLTPIVKWLERYWAEKESHCFVVQGSI